MVTLDQAGRISAATSTNGATHKVPGRVGDGPIPGAGAYAEQGVGGCGGTGDGDLHLRFSPCYQVCFMILSLVCVSSVQILSFEFVFEFRQ
jgi:N4-(beta-N-acetylglucosaminyl)-L-asparaginase